MSVSTPASAPRVRQFTPHVYYSMTKGLCGRCHAPVDAKILFRGDAVVLDKFCPAHGKQECIVSTSVEWYVDALSFLAPADPPTSPRMEVAAGCPFDCGPCASHQQRLSMPARPAAKRADGFRSDEAGRTLTTWVQGRPDTATARAWIEALCTTREVRLLEIELGPGPGGMAAGAGERVRVTVPDVLAALDAATGGRLTWRDFVPSPQAHPHCFALGDLCVAHVGGFEPLARRLSRETLFDLHRDGLELCSSDRLEAALRSAAGREGGGAGGEAGAGETKDGTIKTIAVHAFMDGEDFDVSRVMRCPVGVEGEGGITVPACARSVVFDRPTEQVQSFLRLRKAKES